MNLARRAKTTAMSTAGSFAPDLKAEPALTLVQPLTEWQVKHSTDSYVPKSDPTQTRVQDRLNDLLGDRPTVDQWGHPLSRGGFYRSTQGAAYVTHPDGATDPKTGMPKFSIYGSPSGSAVASDTTALDNWRFRLVAQGYRNPDFAQWANEQIALIEGPSDPSDEDAAPRDPERSEKATLDRIAAEARYIAGETIAADRGTLLHWVTECVDSGQGFESGLNIAAELGFEPEQVRKFADSYRSFCSEMGLVNVDAEIQVVNDEARKAGTTDRLVVLDKPLACVSPEGDPVLLARGERMIADVKTGRSHVGSRGRGADKRIEPNFRGGYASQLATYAGGVPYDSVTGQRSTWPDNVAPSQRWALIVQCHSESVLAGDPKFELEVVDLERGRAYLNASNTLKVAERAADRSSSFAKPTPAGQ